ncbi:MAG: hypothetical protein JSW61_00460 [Candidatus Thorarchaeota archaeon]|nr:MAG: hypothetical protein JSW61_00460 [Candidatus Thorarchaeota archaeon]
MSVTQSDKLHWDNREVRTQWQRIIFASSVLTLLILWIPSFVSAFCLGLSVYLLVISQMERNKMDLAPYGDDWCIVPKADLNFETQRESVKSRGTGGSRHISMAQMKSASTTLKGNLGRLMRAINSEDGIYIMIGMRRERPKRLLDEGIVTKALENYFNKFLSNTEIESYITTRGGLWKTSTCILGHTREADSLRRLQSSIKGAIPDKNLIQSGIGRLGEKIAGYRVPEIRHTFYSTGRDLSHWLVQLASELSSEVGCNVPSEFVAPIRTANTEFRIGRIINPETLLPGPVAGLSGRDISNGLLVCGGHRSERYDIYRILVKQLVNRRKRVLILSRHEDCLSLAGIEENAVGFTLGRDLVLNPVDAEGIPGASYVSKLKIALESVSNVALTPAPEFVTALGRAVAIPGATIADITLRPNEPSETGPEIESSYTSLQGMDAIRALHQGPGAHAFYGSQTIHFSRLAEIPLSIIILKTGSEDLDLLAWDLAAIKIAGIASDSDLVVLMDDPPNLIVSNTHHKRRLLWARNLANEVLQRGPLIVGLRHPSDLGLIADSFSACLSLVLRASHDIKVVSDMLGLPVVGSMHSKARLSARESAYLRMMAEGNALLVDGLSKTAHPVTLDKPPEFEALSHDQMAERRAQLLGEPTDSHKGRHRTLLESVSGRNTKLAVQVLQLLERYEPLTEEAARRFISSSGDSEEDVQTVLIQLEEASMILRGHEVHSGVKYANFRMTLKGAMALRQALRKGDFL